jgi:hypothetical protein
MGISFMKFIVIGGGCYGSYHSGQLYKAIQRGKLPADSQLIIVDRHAYPSSRAEHGAKAGFQWVQSDWQAYLQAFLSDPQQYDPARAGESVHIVPAPFAPHLFFDWLHLATTAYLQESGYTNIELTREGFDYKIQLPYEYSDPQSGNHFLSRAGWTCPAACIEPRLCPAIKDVRDWDLEADLRDFGAGAPAQPSVSAAARLTAAGLPNGQVNQDRPLPGHYSLVEAFTCHHYMFGIGTVPAGRLWEARERVVALALSLKEDRPEARVAVGTVSHCHGVVATLVLKRR